MPSVNPELILQQDQAEEISQPTPVQASLPWKNPKYNREEIPELSLSTEQVLRQEKKRQKREASLAREALERELELERREVGFGCRIMIQATLPHSDPNQGLTPKQPEWRGQFTRKNGNLSLTIQAREEYGCG